MNKVDKIIESENARDNENAKDAKTVRGEIKFGIKWRIISFFSATLVILSLIMILFASYTFSQESTVRLQEGNFDYVRFSGDWIQAEIRNYLKDARYLLGNVGRANIVSSNPQATAVGQTRFDENSSIIFVGIISAEGRLLQSAFNEDRASLLEIEQGQMKRMHRQTKIFLEESLSGTVNIFNASLETTPLTGITFYWTSGKVGLIYLDPSALQTQFASRQFTNMFLVNSDGDVIIHPETDLILTRANLSDNSLVSQMWEQPLELGQSEYSDSDGEVYLASYRKLSLSSLGLIAQVKKSVVFRPIEKIRDRNFLILGLGLCFGVIVIYFLTKVLTAPVLTLSDSMQQVEEGKYVVPNLPVPKHEIGNLILAFQHMVKGLAEREKIRNVLGIFVSKQVAQEVLREDSAKGGEKKKVLVFFSDIRGFTSISEKLAPEQVVQLLNQYLNRMVKCVDKYGGVIDKFIGDGIMAYWGAFSWKGNEIARAIDACLEMRDQVKQFNQDMKKEKLPTIRIGIGLNYGEVVAGIVGSDQRRQYTVIGDTVNLSSRIEGLTKQVGTDILIHESCYHEVKDLYRCVALQPMAVKGKQKTQMLYAVLSRKNNPQGVSDIRILRKELGIPENPQQHGVSA